MCLESVSLAAYGIGSLLETPFLNATRTLRSEISVREKSHNFEGTLKTFSNKFEAIRGNFIIILQNVEATLESFKAF